MREERAAMIIGGEKSILWDDDTGGGRTQGVNRGGRYRVTNSTTLKCIHSSSATGYVDGHGNQPRLALLRSLLCPNSGSSKDSVLERDNKLEKNSRKKANVGIKVNVIKLMYPNSCCIEESYFYLS